jgi:integration host factor subunit beta
MARIIAAGYDRYGHTLWSKSVDHVLSAGLPGASGVWYFDRSGSRGLRSTRHTEAYFMATVTKKELIDQIAEATDQKQVIVKRIVQSFLDGIIMELGRNNRLEFRDFGVFEARHRRGHKAQNPKTLEPISVPAKRTVKFKAGRLMKAALHDTCEEPVRL